MKVLQFKKCLSKLLKIHTRLKIMFLLVFLVTTIGFIYNIYYFKPDLRYCYMESFGTATKSQDKLHDILLHPTIKPIKGRSIFFHETSCPETILKKLQKRNDKYGQMARNFMKLTARQACSIESAALHNARTNIFILFASPRYVVEWINGTETNSDWLLLESLYSYKNIHFRNINLWSYAANTPIYEWLKDGAVFKSEYVLSHLSDVLRYLTMWRWGGTYLDMDTIVLRSLEDLPPNYTGAESDHALAAGVMNFASHGFGHEVAEMCLRDLQKNFNGRDWGNNGPGVITRVMADICQATEIHLMHDVKRCKGFHVYGQEAFYAIPWIEWHKFFVTDDKEEALRRTNHSYIAHFWNNKSKDHIIDVNEECAYTHLAQKHCPRVYHIIKNYVGKF